MKKILLVAVVLSVAFAVKAFAADTQTTTTIKPATTATATATKVETKATETAKTAVTKPVATTTTTAALLKGNITKLDNTNVWVKDNAGKEWTFKVGTISMKDYKVGDNVEVNYEKDNLKSIAKAK
jgi:hypothetical protein